MGRVPEGTPEDVDRAVKAAREGFEAWSQAPLGDRAEACRAIGAGLAQRSQELAALMAREVGMPLPLCMRIQAGLPPVTFTSMADVIEQVEWEEQVANSLVVREPVPAK